MYLDDHRIVLTLDAGGTNFVFSAIQGCQEVVQPIRMPAVTDHLEGCLQTLVQGFTMVTEQLPAPAVAISFAFPGPADYQHGIIGDLPNFPAFRGGVALGPFLSQKFGIPVFINNDGNLFAYGEALAGTLPEVNAMLQKAGSSKRYHNLIGLTLGTGFGAGVVINNSLLTGDNGCGGDVWIMRHPKHPELIAEEGVSIRAVKRVYAQLSGEDANHLTPKEIYEIAEGIREGYQEAARSSFHELGVIAGDSIVRALNLIDGLIVIGGGVSGAAKYILPGLMQELQSQVGTLQGDAFHCVQMEVYNLMDTDQLQEFLEEKSSLISVPGSDAKVHYSHDKKTGVTFSKLGTSRAIALGAYTFALAQLDIFT